MTASASTKGSETDASKGAVSLRRATKSLDMVMSRRLREKSLAGRASILRVSSHGARSSMSAAAVSASGILERDRSVRGTRGFLLTLKGAPSVISSVEASASCNSEKVMSGMQAVHALTDQGAVSAMRGRVLSQATSVKTMLKGWHDMLIEGWFFWELG